MMDKLDRSIARLVQRYGITPTELLQIYDDQRGLCPLCEKPLKFGGRGGAHIDHDHTTGKVRGILCALCNMRLGHAESMNLRRTIMYLEKPCLEVGAWHQPVKGRRGYAPKVLTAEEAEAKREARKAQKTLAQRLRRAKTKKQKENAQ